MPIEVHASTTALSDYCLAKVKLLGLTIGQNLVIFKEGISEADVVKIDGKAKTIVMKKEDGSTIVLHNDMLNYLSERSDLLRKSANVTDWLEKIAIELGMYDRDVFLL